jgi:hypothetical protein
MNSMRSLLAIALRNRVFLTTSTVVAILCAAIAHNGPRSVAVGNRDFGKRTLHVMDTAMCCP